MIQLDTEVSAVWVLPEITNTNTEDLTIGSGYYSGVGNRNRTYKFINNLVSVYNHQVSVHMFWFPLEMQNLIPVFSVSDHLARYLGR